MSTKNPPTICPDCGFDLEGDGYPLGHKTDEGDECSYQWAPADPREWDADGDDD